MHHADFVVPDMDRENQALDLANTLMAVSGVEHIQVDESAHTVAVDYDREYLSEEGLAEIIRHSGYPVEGDGPAE